LGYTTRTCSGPVASGIGGRLTAAADGRLAAGVEGVGAPATAVFLCAQAESTSSAARRQGFMAVEGNGGRQGQKSGRPFANRSVSLSPLFPKFLLTLMFY